MDMAIYGGMVGNFVVQSDTVRAAPAEEFLLDVLAVRMSANVAATSVRTHFRAWSGWGWATGGGLLRLFRFVGRSGASSAFRFADAIDINFQRAWAGIK
jgi:hypothetical protein